LGVVCTIKKARTHQFSRKYVMWGGGLEEGKMHLKGDIRSVKRKNE